MSEPARPRVIAIVGPTAVGKTAVAEAIAARLRGEIVSADSMQVYRGMDVGTAKPPLAERRVPYHCLDAAAPGEQFSAALYQQLARRAIDDIAARGLVPVVCGGTGLYVRAALDDWSFPPGDASSSERERLEALAAKVGPQAAHRLLAEQDPAAAELVHPHNVRRVVRALEMAAAGTPYSEQAAAFARRDSVYDAVFLGLTMDREALYRRIDERVTRMLASGLLDEVRSLLDAGYRHALTASQAIGYKELVPVVEDDADLDEAADAVRRATRRYAKRQLTWFRADPRVRWLDVTGLSAEDAAARGVDLVES